MTLRERYEKETGMVSHQYGGVPREEYVTWLERENAKLEAKLTEVLEIQTVEKFQEIIRNQCDEILALKDQLRWRPVSEKPEKGDWVTLIRIVNGKTDDEQVWFYHLMDVKEWEWLVKTLGATHWLPIPPAREGEC